MPFFKVKLPICRLSVEPQKPVSPKGFELKYRELLSENMFERPCEKNNFKGAFELKSANGSFGIRIEVQQGRHVPY